MGRVIQVSKKYAIYLPRKLVEELNLKEGDVLLAKVEEGRIILKPIREG